jgi:signal transduction histidine kinase
VAGAETTTRRGRRPRAPSLWVLAAGLLAVAGLAFVGASRVGDDIDRLERAESLSFQLEARVFEQAALESRTSASGVPDDSARQRADTMRREIAGALAELTSLLPGDRDAAATAKAAADWQAALDTKLSLLAAGDLVAANRADRAQIDPSFQRLADQLRTTSAAYHAGEERSRLVNKILSVAERQRSGMAAELHDGPIQALTRLGILLERGRLRLRRGQVEDGVALLADAQAALADEVQALRGIMATLRPPVLEERGLVSALGDYVEVVREQAGINCTLSARLPERLPEDQEIVLYRVAQEALTNVARHARASSARVELVERADKVMLEVHDDGVGFDPARELVGSLDHFGLAGMRERVELAGGTWTVWSREGSGTVLTATLPRARVAA